MAEAEKPSNKTRPSVGAGLTIVSTLAPTLGIVLPVWFRWLLFVIGVILMLSPFFQAAFNRARKMGMEPVHLQIIGLVGIVLFAALSVGGLIWQSQVTPSPDPRVGHLQSQLEILTRESAEKQTAAALDLTKTKQALEEKTRELEGAKAQATAATATAPKPKADSAVIVLSKPPDESSLLVPGRFYSTAEKERIVDTMNLIQQRFNSVRRVMYDAEKIASNPGQNEEIDRSINKLRAVYVGVEEVSNDLEKVRNESHSYPVDFAVLLAAKPVYYDEFQRAISDYSNALIVYRRFLTDTGENRGTLAQNLDSSKRHLSRAKFSLEKWLGECDEQMRGARRLLEK
ncbi:hypothetical protein ACVWWG_008724 [Bradyrhizobium sp. LB7.2]|uniref:hypothetical protein n=1 Tax=Bradyrhizobium sp. LB14.3 TaxID=3156328 RepID=UPI00339B6E20